MNTLPRHRGSDPAAAAGDRKAEREHCLFGTPAAKSQCLVLDLDDLHFQRVVARLHRLGERLLGAFLAELSARLTIRTEVEQLLAKYTQLRSVTVDAVGARHFHRRDDQLTACCGINECTPSPHDHQVGGSRGDVGGAFYSTCVRRSA
jgi:hypothetical protein